MTGNAIQALNGLAPAQQELKDLDASVRVDMVAHLPGHRGPVRQDLRVGVDRQQSADSFDAKVGQRIGNLDGIHRRPLYQEQQFRDVHGAGCT